MGYIEISDQTYRALRALADTWNTTVAAALGRLVMTHPARLTTRPAPTEPPPAPVARMEPTPAPAATEVPAVAVFARYVGTLTRATFDPHNHTITITTGPLSGRDFATPTAAMRAVIQHTNPTRSGAGNGWLFWIVAATGDPIQVLRATPPTPVLTQPTRHKADLADPGVRWEDLT